MIFNILKEGVKGAFVRIIRTIVYVIILVAILFLLGSCNNSKRQVNNKGGLYEYLFKK